jgi:hypothetical protein
MPKSMRLFYLYFFDRVCRAFCTLSEGASLSVLLWPNTSKIVALKLAGRGEKP